MYALPQVRVWCSWSRYHWSRYLD